MIIIIMIITLLLLPIICSASTMRCSFSLRSFSFSRRRSLEKAALAYIRLLVYCYYRYYCCYKLVLVVLVVLVVLLLLLLVVVVVVVAVVVLGAWRRTHRSPKGGIRRGRPTNKQTKQCKAVQSAVQSSAKHCKKHCKAPGLRVGKNNGKRHCKAASGPQPRSHWSQHEALPDMRTSLMIWSSDS